VKINPVLATPRTLSEQQSVNSCILHQQIALKESLLNTNDNTVLHALSSLALRLDSDENKQEDCIKMSMACKSSRSWKVNIDAFRRGKQGQM